MQGNRCGSLPGGHWLAVALLLPVLAVLMPGRAAAEITSETLPYRQGDTELLGTIYWDDALEGPRPGVLVIHEWWGQNDFARAKAEWLAGQGYIALAVDMYGARRTTTDSKVAGSWAGEVRNNDLMRPRARAALDALVGTGRVDGSRVAAIGFCFGGTSVLELAFSGAPLRGVVCLHGSLPPPSNEDLEGLQASILVLNGGEDPMVPPDDVKAFVEAISPSDADWQLMLFGNAVHAFTNPGADRAGIGGVGYHEDSARRAMELTRWFLEERLGD